MNIYVILNGAPLRYESRRLNIERFFAALRMTNNSLLIVIRYHIQDRRAGKRSASRLFTLIPYGAGQIASTSATG